MKIFQFYSRRFEIVSCYCYATAVFIMKVFCIVCQSIRICLHIFKSRIGT